MFHYTYLTSDGNRYYIGSRTSKREPIFDEYMGSHYDKTFKPTEKTILGIHNDKTDKIAAEIYWQRLFKVAENPLFANRVYQTSTKFDRTGSLNNDKQKEAARKAQKGKAKTAEHKEKVSQTKKDKTLWLFINEKTGEERICTYNDMWKSGEIRSGNLSRITLGKRRTSNKWRVACLL